MFALYRVPRPSYIGVTAYRVFPFQMYRVPRLSMQALPRTASFCGSATALPRACGSATAAALGLGARTSGRKLAFLC